MKFNFMKAGALALGLGMVFTSCQTEEVNIIDNQVGDMIAGSYIVVFEDGAKSNLQGRSVLEAQAFVADMAEGMIPETAELGNVYSSALVGFSVEGLSIAQANFIASLPNVKYVEQDRMVTLAPPCGTPKGGPCAPPEPPAQTTPYGTPRVGGGGAYNGSAVAWIIDTGIDQDHDDLNVDNARSVTFTNDGLDDGNGHGTHCAGTVAAIDNSIGSLGVAPGATVVGVKVLDNSGSGSYSGVIGGVDHVAANAAAGDAANMSLGGGFSQAVNDAVIALGAAGVYTAVAAGNSSTDASTASPASANGTNVYTISAMDSNDNFASFSNYGADVDYAAPGVSVYSTYRNNGYASLNGTSMASPHACGVLLVTGGAPNTSGFVNNDPDGNADPIISIN